MVISISDNMTSFCESLPKTDDAALIVFYRGLGEYYKKNLEQAETNFDHAFELDRSLLQAEIGQAISFGIRHQNAKATGILHALETKINERGVVDPEAIYKIAQAYAIDRRQDFSASRLAPQH